MARLVDYPRRTALLDRVVQYLGHHGLVDVSFRPMAKALGVSVNALVHHFGTKDDLLAAALRRSGQIQDDVERHWLERRPGLTPSELLRAWWKWALASHENLAIARLGIEAAAHLPTDDHREGLDRRRNSQLKLRPDIEGLLLSQGVPPNVASIEATLARAVLNGLVVEYVANGNKSRLTRALDVHLAHLDQVIADSALGTS
ncbi:MAG: TetR/AcrR family transcriptional regulator [Ilumatobacteraceae bacterium]